VTEPTFSRVLVALDLPAAGADDPHLFVAGGRNIVLSPAVRHTLELAAQLAGGSTITVLHAPPSLMEAVLFTGAEGIWAPQPPLRELDAQAERRAREVVGAVCDRLLPESDVEIRIVAGVATAVILREAERLKADAIVLATSGRGVARRFLMGTTADRVIRHAPCPVLVVPAHAYDPR
jgi:nucleotide-binding universal stress UspA family protein